jgi:ATP-binding cassette, subfamily C (CFTR/MRP), member 1
MDQGRIVEEGTYEELLSKGGNFARLIEKFKDKEGGETVEEEMKTSTESKPERPEKGLMGLEGRSTGSVPWIVYRDYARSGGGLWIIPVIGGVLLISNGVNIMTSLWLGSWTINRYNLSTKIYVAVYACFGSLQGICSFIFGYILVVIGNRAARKLHEQVATPLALLNLGIESSRKCANVIF